MSMILLVIFKKLLNATFYVSKKTVCLFACGIFLTPAIAHAATKRVSSKTASANNSARTAARSVSTTTKKSRSTPSNNSVTKANRKKTTGTTANVKGQTSQKLNQKNRNNRKFGVSKRTAGSANYQSIVTVHVYSTPSQSYIRQLSGIVLGSELIAARLPRSVPYSWIQNDIQFYIGQRSVHKVQPVEVELASRWILFRTNAQALRSSGVQSTLPNYAEFEYPNAQLLQQDLHNISALAAQKNRAIAGDPSLNDLISRKISSVGTSVAHEITEGRSAIRFYGQNFGPAPTESTCGRSPVLVEAQGIQKKIASAQSVTCTKSYTKETGGESVLDITVQAGRLQIYSPGQLSPQERQDLTTNLLGQRKREFLKDSANVSDSGPAICSIQYLTSENMEIHHCIRQSRQFSGLNHSIFLIGRLVQGQYNFVALDLKGTPTERLKDIVRPYVQAISELR